MILSHLEGLKITEKSRLALKYLAQYWYNSVGIDLQLCTQFFTFSLNHPPPEKQRDVIADCDKFYADQDIEVNTRSALHSRIVRDEMIKEFRDFFLLL